MYKFIFTVRYISELSGGSTGHRDTGEDLPGAVSGNRQFCRMEGLEPKLAPLAKSSSVHGTCQSLQSHTKQH